MHLKFGKEKPLELLRWEIAEHFGWTLGQVDSLTVAEMHEWVQIIDARAKARAKGDKVA